MQARISVGVWAVSNPGRLAEVGRVVAWDGVLPRGTLIRAVGMRTVE
jgi:hypothetical protein